MALVKTIIVTYNGEHYIEKCIASVLNSSIQTDIIIIDNNSSDNTVKIISEKFPSVELIRSNKNHGFGKANNIGISRAIKNDFDYILLLNQDAYLEKNTIEGLMQIHKKNHDYGILSPIHYNNNNSIDHLFYKNIGENFTKNVGVSEVKFINAAIWLISSECINVNGGFMPIFPHYGEDDNYCHRVRFSGYKIGYCPNLTAIHDRGDRKKFLSINYHFNRTYVALLTIFANPFNNKKRTIANELLKFIMQNFSRIHVMILMPLAFLKILLNYKSVINHKNQSLERNINFLQY